MTFWSVLPNNTLSQTDNQISIPSDTNRLKTKVGVFGSYGPNLNFSDFSGLPGVPSCCPGFEFTFSSGFEFGGLIEIPLDTLTSIGVRGYYYGTLTNYEKVETNQVIIDNQIQDIVSTHFLETDYGYLGINALYGYRLWKELNLWGGVDFQVPINSSYTGYEQITSEQGTFGDGRRINNESSGTIDNPRIKIGLNTIASYDLPLEKRPGLFLSPFVSLAYYPIGPVSDTQWTDMLIRGGIALKYRKPPLPPPPPPPPARPPFPILADAKEPPSIIADLEIVQIDTIGNEKKELEVKIEDFVSFNMRPLLNYVFFEENSSNLPDRYISLNTSQVREFGINQLSKADDLQTYYNVLNIVGDRLRSDLDIDITITGHISNDSIEKGQRELASQRAESVKKYLVDNWYIDPSRITLKSRGLPQEASRTDTLPGHQENRRVEITSSNPDLFSPVLTNDTIRSISKTSLKLLPTYSSDIKVKNWSIFALQGSDTLFQKSGYDIPPSQIEWDINNNTSSLKDGNPIICYFSITDQIGNVATSKSQIVSIEQLTVDRKRLERKADKEFEYYSLILFDYGKTSLNKEHRATVDFVKSRIEPEDFVKIEGFSDSMGEEEINQKIALKRAKSVENRLRHRKAETVGIGENRLLFDNSLPEGRFYCRTVKITVESEVKDAE
ncbi:MAG: hypothetical protein Kapaf2KO_14580 [Candidatus Kapaibacteriales bacterium]